MKMENNNVLWCDVMKVLVLQHLLHEADSLLRS
jgi:hypothetical protein